MCNIKNLLSEYCAEQAHRLCLLAGLQPQYITNDNYILVRNSMHYKLRGSDLSKAVYDLTSLLSFVSFVGYPQANNV